MTDKKKVENRLVRVIKDIKQRIKFKKDMKEWVRLCKVPNRRRNCGVVKAGILTHEIEIDGFSLETRDPIFIKDK